VFWVIGRREESTDVEELIQLKGKKRRRSYNGGGYEVGDGRRKSEEKLEALRKMPRPNRPVGQAKIGAQDEL